MNHAIGIDLGTTYSAIARVNELGKPEILLNREGESITPSVVLFQGDLPLVGSMAKRSAATAPDDVVQFVKRQMGNPNWKFTASSGDTYTPEEVSALILKRLAEDAELTLGEGSVSDVVITVPAYFDDARRRATMDAGRIAGLNVMRVINEPTAAALAYGVDSGADGTFLVFDLGGGTFDVTVMKVAGGTFEVIATDGDRNLGGFDWDNRLIEHVNQQFVAEGGDDLLDDDHALADLREKAELAKRSLTSVARANVMVTHNGLSKAIPVTREKFEEIAAGLLSRTRHTVEEVVTSDAGMAWSDLDRVLLVGGSTRMPMVRAMLEELTGKQAERSANPDEIVAQGAALQAQIESVAQNLPVLAEARPTEDVIVVRDVTSQSLGVLLVDDDENTIVNTPVITRNTPIPAKGSVDTMTLVDSQSHILVEVTEGEGSDPDYVTKVGEQEISIPRYPRGAPFSVIYSYDIDQIIHVEVIDSTTGLSVADFEIDNNANMSRDSVNNSRVRLAQTNVG